MLHCTIICAHVPHLGILYMYISTTICFGSLLFLYFPLLGSYHIFQCFLLLVFVFVIVSSKGCVLRRSSPEASAIATVQGNSCSAALLSNISPQSHTIFSVYNSVVFLPLPSTAEHTYVGMYVCVYVELLVCASA